MVYADGGAMLSEEVCVLCPRAAQHTTPHHFHLIGLSLPFPSTAVHPYRSPYDIGQGSSKKTMAGSVPVRQVSVFTATRSGGGGLMPCDAAGWFLVERPWPSL